MNMFVVVSYDISDDRRRNKVAKTMLDYGIRVQYSVFECWLPAKEYQRMKQRIAALIKDEEDSVRFYRLCEPCVNRLEILGRGEIIEEQPFLIL